MKVVYGIFDDRAAAEAAVESIDLPVERWTAFVHGDPVREEDVQLGCTQMVRGAVVGGLVVGVLGALAAVFFIWPSHGWHGAWLAGLTMTFSGTLFGVVAGGVAGAAECKDTIRDEVGYATRHGKVIVTAELERGGDSERVIEAFEARGAEHVHAA